MERDIFVGEKSTHKGPVQSGREFKHLGIIYLLELEISMGDRSSAWNLGFEDDRGCRPLEALWESNK